jgi:hypothetical protein
MSNRDHRYDDILRRIAQRQHDEQRAPPLHQLARVLDDVNAFGQLEELQQQQFHTIQCFGPKSINSGLKPTAPSEVWEGVVVWCKQRGYYSYRTLTLLGIWAIMAGEAVTLALGTKQLAFTGHYYNAESYFRHIKSRFDIYYEDDGSPPDESRRLYSVQYDSAQRLAIRQALSETLARWGATDTGE